MNETLGSTGMGPEEPVVPSRSGHRNRNVFMLGGLALVLVAGVILAGVFPTGDRAGTTTSDPSASATPSATPSATATDDPTDDPTTDPSATPSANATEDPTDDPTTDASASATPSATATDDPTDDPTTDPSAVSSPPARATVLTCAQGGACSVGDVGPGGGLVFYDAGSVQYWGQFLEFAPKAWNGGSADPTDKWCNPTVDVEGTGKNIGWGLRSTEAIAQACTESAAAMAKAYGGGELSDWFLPSKGELQVLSAYVQDKSNNLNSYAFGNSYYWSSTRPNKTSGYGLAIYVTTGQDYVRAMGQTSSVRPVRAF